MQLTITSTHDVLEALKHASDVSSQSLILHAIKNSLTGHELRKIEYIRAGLLPILSDVIGNLAYSSSDDDSTKKAQEVVWSHAASMIGVLAGSGPAFTYPILQTNLLHLLSSRFTRAASPRLDLIILRCLNSIADNLPQQSELVWAPSPDLSQLLYTSDTIARIVYLFGEDEIKTHSQQQSVDAALTLICKTCENDWQRDLLVKLHLLNRLSDELELFINRHTSISHTSDHVTYTINHALASSQGSRSIALVLEAIGIIIEYSAEHARDFANYIGVLASAGVAPDSSIRRQIQQSEDPVYSTASYDIPLPNVPDFHAQNARRRSPFPPLSATSTTTKRRTSSMRVLREENTIFTEEGDQQGEGEYLIVPWLLHVVRTSRGRYRAVAARLLSILKHHGLVSPVRARSFASLLVPIVVEPIDSFPENVDMHDLPSTLALIVRDNECLQRAAVDLQAIPKLVGVLKSTFDVIQDRSIHLWWPRKLDEKLTTGNEECRLGTGGPSLDSRRNMLRREGSLQALASLAPDEDDYRANIIDCGALVYIMQALEPLRSQTIYGDDGDTIQVHGNSSSTIIAACGVVRALTRSPTALRTKLVDADIAKPVIKLLYSTEPQVKIAATMVIANLAHDFSPMKPSIEPVVRKLCEQAHSANAHLRRESLFALKALVNNSKNELKRNILGYLGPNWIKHLIATDPHDVPPGEIIGLVPREYQKGSMIRLSEESTMDVDQPPQQIEPEEYSAHTLQDDLNIQAELLGFLRNLTTGDKAEEIIDYLFEQIGLEDFMQIIADRLKSGTVQRPSAAATPSAIIFNSIYILAHLCSAARKYRQVIYQNVVLMKQTLALLGHTDPLVRRAACWLVTNLIYHNPNEELDTLIQRARELQKLGIVNQIRRMEKSDPVTDVKERAATAAECFSKLLNTA